MCPEPSQRVCISSLLEVETRKKTKENQAGRSHAHRAEGVWYVAGIITKAGAGSAGPLHRQRRSGQR